MELKGKSCEGCVARVAQDAPSTGFECRCNPPQVVLFPVQVPAPPLSLMRNVADQPQGPSIEMRPVGIYPPADRRCMRFAPARSHLT